MAIRVVQWTTGNVGKRSVRAVVSNPALDLVGCYAWSPDKVGRDVGELAGIEPIGVAATDDIDAPDARCQCNCGRSRCSARYRNIQRLTADGFRAAS